MGWQYKKNMLVQVERSQQDQAEAIQQQQDVLLLAFTRFRDLLLEAEKACDELKAGASGEMNGTANGAAGKRKCTCAEMLWRFQVIQIWLLSCSQALPEQPLWLPGSCIIADMCVLA